MSGEVTRRGPTAWLPRISISGMAGFLFRTSVSRLLIRPYIRRYGVRVDELARPVRRYTSLLDFFCREIAPGSRSIAPGQGLLASPVDGRISNFGRIDDGRLIQAKGIDYTPAGLLGEISAASRYEKGFYITIYLSPANYHRIHAPASATVRRTKRIRGARWPVNDSGATRIPGLFEKNERVITYLDTQAFGRIALVKVGAYIVGRIVMTYGEAMIDSRHKGRRGTGPPPRGVTVFKGDELARFEFGSTVILLVERGPYRWASRIRSGASVMMGQPILQRK